MRRSGYGAPHRFRRALLLRDPRRGPWRQRGAPLVGHSLRRALVEPIPFALQARDGRRIGIAGPDVDNLTLLAWQVGVDHVQVIVEALVDWRVDGPGRCDQGYRADGDADAGGVLKH